MSILHLKAIFESRVGFLWYVPVCNSLRVYIFELTKFEGRPRTPEDFNTFLEVVGTIVFDEKAQYMPIKGFP